MADYKNRVINFTVIEHLLSRVTVDDKSKEVLETLSEIIENLKAGNKDKILADLRKYDDVSETLILAGKGAELRTQFNMRQGIYQSLNQLLVVAAMFAPQAAAVKAAVSAVEVVVDVTNEPLIDNGKEPAPQSAVPQPENPKSEAIEPSKKKNKGKNR